MRVQAVDGRGDVSVVQQPSAYNNYTTIVRVRDRSSGSDRYRLNAYWESRYSDNRGGNGGYGRQGRDGGDDGNGSWGRNGDSRDVPSRIDPRDRSNGGWGNGGSGNGGYGNGGYGNGAALRWSGPDVCPGDRFGLSPRNQGRQGSGLGCPNQPLHLGSQPAA